MLAKYYINGTEFDNRYDLFKYITGDENQQSYDVSDVQAKLNIHNDYKFKRQINYQDLFQLAKKRLQTLKESGKKIHFWYSGGMDSHFVLYCMKLFDIWPDTINTYIIDPSDGKLEMLHRNEGTPAIEFLSEFGVPDYVEKIVWDVGSEQFLKTIKLDKFTEYSSIFQYSHIFVTNFFYKTIDDFPVGEDHIHLKGSVTPHMWYDKGWKFAYVDYQFEGVVYGHSEYFIDADSEFLEAYINSILNVFESKYGKFGFDMMHTLTKNNDRFMKKLCPEIVKAYEGINWVQYAKSVKESFKTDIEIVDLILKKTQVKAHDIYKKSFENNYNWVKVYNDNVVKHQEIIKKDFMRMGFHTEIHKLS